MNDRALISANALSAPLAALLAVVSCAQPGDSAPQPGGAPADAVETSGDVGTTHGPDAARNPADVGAGPACGVPLTQWERMMLDAHNWWRASVDPPAADMLRLYWDATIAANAAQWVSSCDPDWPHSPDESREGVGGYDALGENLYYCAGTGCADDPAVTDGSGKGDGQGWWEERHDYAWADDSSSGVTSHYTQMVSSNVYAIGCAAQRCDPPGPFGWDGAWWWVICQYGPRGRGYWSGTKPYEAGPGGLVEPPAEVFDDHPGLCDPSGG